MHGRCLGPTRSLQGKVEGTAQRRCCWPEPGVQGRRRLAAPVRPCAMNDITQTINRERKLR
ncbi:hypothetical protein H7U18_06800 [Klebsiella pneumoniae]|uniref:Uncharacterized protein n=1 Tax=Klebsiella pneumoniae TaxID=573 RepID=A0A923EMV2_KLEPN|nr:hypothetical protein [Klebsiella pneumoniae]